MLSETTINEYIKSIPPIPEVVKNCISAINAEDLVKAADIAIEDRALMKYLENIVNKPIFGFRSDIKNARQMFGVLGLTRAKQLIYSYYILLLVPKNWEVFEFDNHKFQDFQARLIHNWSKVLKTISNNNKEIDSAITIIPAALIVCEMLFRQINDTVKLLRERKNMSYENILEKMTGRTLFDIASIIAKEWGFSQEVIELVKNISQRKEGVFGKNAEIMQYLRLLLIFEMSRPVMIQSGLSDMFELDAAFDEKISENFYTLISE